MREHTEKALKVFKIPSQSVWRSFELEILEKIRDSRGLLNPVLEIGCGDGMFASFLFDTVDAGIDINPRCIERQRLKEHRYGELYCMDACNMSFTGNKYLTVLANCVIEHIDEYEKVISECHRVLQPGGKLVFTVPLSGINKHLISQSDWYIKLRQRQLCHVNLFSADMWADVLRRHGFDNIEVFPYLFGGECYLWDLIDSPFCIGHKRYKVASAYLLLLKMMPEPLQDFIYAWMARILSILFRNRKSGEVCAAAVVAEKR